VVVIFSQPGGYIYIPLDPDKLLLLLDDIVLAAFEPSFDEGTSSRSPVSCDLGTDAEVRYCSAWP